MASELPSGRQYTLVLGEQQAVVVEVGAALRSYLVAGRELLGGYGEQEMATSARGQVLIPWPNRLKDGSYTWAATQHQLPLSEPEKRNAIHGLVRWANWTAVRQTTAEVELRHVLHPQPGYPFTLELSVAYRLEASGLTVTTTATNVGEEPLPYASGQHPYLTAPGVVDDCRLELDAGTYLQTDDRGLPTGRAPVDGTQYDFRNARQVGEVELDVAFTDLARDDAGRACVTFTTDSGDVARVWVDRSYRYVELFTGDSVPDESRRRRSLGVEPMTAPPNAFADGVDVTALEPGQSTTSAWGLQYTPAAQQSTDTDTVGGST
jgi:aldose 1-epimerase